MTHLGNIDFFNYLRFSVVIWLATADIEICVKLIEVTFISDIFFRFLLIFLRAPRVFHFCASKIITLWNIFLLLCWHWNAWYCSLNCPWTSIYSTCPYKTIIVGDIFQFPTNWSKLKSPNIIFWKRLHSRATKVFLWRLFFIFFIIFH